MSEQDEVELDTQDQPTEEVVNTEVAEETTQVETESIQEHTEAEKKLFARAKKAEAEAKLAKQELAKLKQTNSPPTTDADELKLIARGYSDEAIEQAKVIAKGTGKSLTEAIKSPLFEAFEQKQKAEERKEKARLNASKGSSQEVQKSMSDLSRDDHQKLAMEAAKNIQ